MRKKHLIKILILSLLLAAPNAAFALIVPQSANDLANMVGVQAKAYIVADAESGKVLISKNENLPLIPASLTKLITALVVLDTKTKLSQTVAMTEQDQVVGLCKHRGVCIKSKAGVKFTVDGLFHAALILSANNAANALARSTGLSKAKFVEKMNEKAAELGAINSRFTEPMGLDTGNTITASDYAKILTTAFSNSYLLKINSLSQYYLRSSNNSKYNQTIKNTDKLLIDPDIQVLGAKTGYLDESGYNFSALLKYRNGQELAIVVLGENHLYTAYAETKILAVLAEEYMTFAALNPLPYVLGTSTFPIIINN